MRLINNDGVVLAQHRVTTDFCQQDSVCHQFDEGCWAHLIRESDLVPDNIAGVPTDAAAKFFCNPLSNSASSYSSGLCVTNHPFDPTSQFQTDLGELRCLSGAGFTRNNHNLVVLDRFRDLVPLPTNGQVWVRYDRQRCGTLCKLCGRVVAAGEPLRGSSPTAPSPAMGFTRWAARLLLLRQRPSRTIGIWVVIQSRAYWPSLSRCDGSEKRASSTTSNREPLGSI